jgi:CubicO group peptidase (beta-lactamase class C family)
MVRGVVHDENAYAMGGISGHAGLFSTAPDLVKFVQWMLGHFPRQADGTSAPRTPHPVPAAGILSDEIVQRFTQVQEPAFSSRALGWDTPSGNSSAGSHLSPRAFGHTGFTGTSIWIDPTQDLFVILLTNRVHPTRDNTQIFAVRRAVADAAVEIAARR